MTALDDLSFIVRWKSFGPMWSIEVTDHSNADLIGTTWCAGLAFTRRGAQRKAKRIARRLASTPRPGGEVRVP